MALSITSLQDFLISTHVKKDKYDDDNDNDDDNDDDDVPVVGVSGLFVVLEGLAHHQDVVAASEWIRIDLDRVEVSVRVAALCLVGGAAIIVPDGQVRHTLRLGVQSLGLGSQTLSSSINPDVASLNPRVR